MMKLTAVLFLYFSSMMMFGQQYKVKSFEEVDSFLSNSNDTLYVINFWATWCVPCIEELPGFEKLNALDKSKKIKVILISLDTESNREKRLIPFLEEHQLKSEVWVMPNLKPIDWIDRVDPKWQGSIPATLFFNHVKGINEFSEHAFTYEELLSKIELLQ